MRKKVLTKKMKEKILKIRYMAANGVSRRIIADATKTKYRHVGKIINKEVWPEVKGE